MTLVDVLVLALATWRLTSLLLNERGPWALLARLRALGGVEHDRDGEPVSWPATEVGTLLGCHWCSSVWVGLGLAGLYLLAPGLALVLSLPLALSAAVILVQEVMQHGSRGH